MIHIKKIIDKKRKQLETERRRKKFINYKLNKLADNTLIDRMTK